MNNVLDRFPFLTYGTYLSEDYIGIIGNSDNEIISIYTYNIIKDEKFKKIFLLLGEKWWWETNHQIPINIIYKKEWSIFKSVMKTFITKEFKIISGPILTLNDDKKIKKKQINLNKL